MLGAIIGDIIGSVYEFDNTRKFDFPLFDVDSYFTDDGVMSFAVAQWLLTEESHSPQRLADIMRSFYQNEKSIIECSHYRINGKCNKNAYCKLSYRHSKIAD